MDELVWPQRVRDLKACPAGSTVDENTAAASQPKLCMIVIDVLWPGRRAADLGFHEIGRRPTVDGNQQLGRGLEASQPDAVRTE